ncbi:MAG: hypothetical protein H0X26_09730, partial [Alphaproteobacteria bacterium]|nr:hypothetical protein [Alphaproteobacteria bacterium]
ILKQGAAAFVGLAQHLGSAMTSAASGAAAETVSGNISMGNVSMGTQAYQNTSAFQHSTSPTYNASQFKTMGGTGVEQSTFADGTQSLNNQALSQLSVQIMGSENTSFVTNEHLNSAKSFLESKSAASSQASEAAIQDTTNFLSSVGKAISSGEDSHKSISATDSKSLQDFKNYVKDIQQNTNMSEAQAVEAAIGASVGTPKILGFGAEMSGSFSSTAARQKGITDAESVAKNTNYSQSFDQVMSASQGFSEAHNHTNNKELGHSASASLNRAQSLREEVSIAQTQVDTLSKDISSSEGKSMSINKNLTQPLLEFIARQPVNPGPHLMSPHVMGDHLMAPTAQSQGKIGYEGARHIMEANGAEAKSYYKRFEQENPQYSIQSINSVQTKSALSSNFETESAKLRESSDSGVTQRQVQNTGNILAQGKRAGVDPNHTPQSIQQDVTGFIGEKGKAITEGKKVIDEQEEKLRATAKVSQEKTLGGAASKNLLKSGWDGVTSVAGDLHSDKPQPVDQTPYNSPLNRK